MPNGPKISSGGSLSPRGDWRMPSDADASVWLADRHVLCVALSWATLLVEGLFPMVLWRPRLAPLFVSATAATHVGIWITMRAPFWLYLPLFAVFVPWSRLLRSPSK